MLSMCLRAQQSARELLLCNMHDSVLACKAIREWFEKDKQNEIFLHWCPSHVEIKLNEEVDKLAAEVATKTVQPETTSWAYVRHKITKKEIDNWHQQIVSHKLYRGHGLVGGNHIKKMRSIKHMSDSWFLLYSRDKNREMVRLTRMMSGHAPIGEFSERFKP